MISANLSPLTNHLWQSTLFAGAVWLMTLALRNNRAAVRYWLWLAASLKFLIPFSLLVSAGSRVGWKEAPAAQPQISLVDEISQPFGVPVPAPPLAPPRRPPIDLGTILFGVWFCGFAMGAIYWVRLCHRIRAAKREATPLDLGLPIQVRLSRIRLEPGVFGIRKPVLLLPQGITERLTPAQLEAVVAHELSHVRRRDNLTAAIHMAVETVFWFHPLMRWIRARLIEERERACDEEVLGLATDPQVYAEGILNVCKLYFESPLICLSGVTGADLKRRIEFITENRVIRNLNFGKRILLLTAAMFALLGPMALGILHPSPGRAQAAAPATLPAFEVASVKPSNEPEGSSSWNTSPAGSLRMRNQTLRALIRIAYAVRDDRVSGGPKWLDSDRYTINAKAAGPAKDPELLLMLQVLLKDRFKLSLHRESRMSPGFALAVAKNGLKIHPVEPSKKNRLNSRGGHMVAEAASLERLAQVLTSILGSPVFDETHVSEAFNFTLDWTVDDNRAGRPPAGSPVDEARRADNPTSVATDPSSGVSLFSALQDQLGLKLEARKIPAEILVIDHAEKPAELDR